MKNIKNKHGILHTSYFHHKESVDCKAQIQNEHSVTSAIYNTAILIVLVVCGMVASGILKEVSIQIGILAEVIMLVAITFYVWRKKQHHQ